MRLLATRWLLIYGLLLSGRMVEGQAMQEPGSSRRTAEQPATLEREFFAAIRDGDTKKFLSYVPEQGMNVGSQPEHLTRAEIEQQFAQHRDLYCKLFDSSCIQSPIKLDASTRACSYRDLLTSSEKVRTAATETIRGGVHQAILVAEVKNNQCPGLGLIDFIFNESSGGWKLFSAP